MTFPQTALDVWARLQIDGVWTDISSDVRSTGTDAITITRGISASGGVLADPGTCSLTLDNNSGNYSARNPLSPYYPYLGLNTPIQVGAAYGTPWLDLPYGQTTTATTPDASVLDITGDLDVAIDIEMAVWGDVGTVGTTLIGKTSTGQLSWYLWATEEGCVALTWSTDGTLTTTALSGPLNLPPNSRVSLRATLDVNNNSGGWTVTFYTSTTAGTAGPWTQLSVTSGSGTTSIFSGTAALSIGDIAGLGLNAGNVARKIYAAQVRSGIAGTVVANPSFESQAVSATGFADTAPSPRTWTVPASSITNRYLRFFGEVSEWPPQWTTGGKDVTTPIRATGLLQRYGQAKNTLRSPMRLAITTIDTDNLQGYWPLEDGTTATQAASGLLNGQPMRTVGGVPRFGATAGPPGSLPLPDFSNGGHLLGTIRSGVATSWTVECLTKFPTSLPLGFAAAISWTVAGTRANVWEIDAQPVGDGGLSVQWANSAFSDFGGPYYSNIAINDDAWHHVRVTVAQAGTAITIAVDLDGTRVINETEASVTLGAIQSVDVNEAGADDGGVPSVGHVAVWSPSTSGATYTAVTGWAGDTAAGRLRRLVRDQGAQVSIAAVDDDTELVGPQPIDTLLTTVVDAVRADEGLLYEARERLGLRARGRTTLYSQAPVLDLPYVADPQPLMAPLTPVGDLQGRLNDSTVTRANGSSGRYQLTEGRLSVQEPPNGIGSGYEEDVTLNLHSDDRTTSHAAWRVHLGTVDADRFPQVNVWLEKAPALIPVVCRLDTGSRLRITPPLLDQLPPDAIDQMVLGYTEVLAQFAWRFSLSCQPYAPYLVGVVGDDVFGRADTDGSEVATGVNATATSLSVATLKGPLWTTRAAEFPFDIAIGGEVMTVTNITGASSPQTFTVTRSVNGVSKSQTAHTDVRLANPMIVSL